jgi:hypothetical protein
MTRVLGTFGLAILFLTISGNLRETVMEGVNWLEQWLAVNSPLSYVGVGVLILAGMMFGLHRASQPRV